MLLLTHLPFQGFLQVSVILSPSVLRVLVRFVRTDLNSSVNRQGMEKGDYGESEVELD